MKTLSLVVHINKSLYKYTLIRVLVEMRCVL